MRRSLFPLIVCIALLASACVPTIRINGKATNTDDGAEAATRYYQPQFDKIVARKTPLPITAVFLVPNTEFAEANWVHGKSHLSPKQLHFFRHFTVVSWVTLGRALKRGGVFQDYSLVPTLAGTSDPQEDVKIAAGTLVVGHTAKNKIVVYRFPDRDKGVVITQKLSPGHELSMMTNLIISAARKISGITSAAPPKIAKIADRRPKIADKPPKDRPIVAVFDAQAKRIALAKTLLRALSDAAATRLAASRRYRVVPPDQLRKRLRTKKSASHRACFDSSCQIDIGRELAAQKSLAITITKIGTRCSVNAILYDLKQAASEGAALATGTCTEEGLLKTTEEAIHRLTGGAR